MVKWWNTVMKLCNNKYLHLIMVKWYNKYGEMVQIIHTSSHGEMVKHTSGDILFAKWQNGETVIFIFVILLFCAPLQRWAPIPLLDSIIYWILRLVSVRCRVDHIIVSQAAPTPFDAVPSRWFWLIHFFFTFLPPLPTPGGFVTSSFSPFINVPILVIYYIISVLL